MPHLSIGPAKPRAANPAHRFPVDQTSALPIRPLTPPRLQPRLFPLSVSNAAQQRFFAKPHTPTSRPACPTPDAIGSGETVPPTTCPAGATRSTPQPGSTIVLQTAARETAAALDKKNRRGGTFSGSAPPIISVSQRGLLHHPRFTAVEQIIHAFDLAGCLHLLNLTGYCTLIRRSLHVTDDT